MKKILLFVYTSAVLFLAGSCHRENLEPVQQGGTVTYTIQVPGDLATKATGDGFTLYYEVYRLNELGDSNAKPVYEGSQAFSNGSADVKLEFVKNQKFTVLFWAQKTTGAQAYDIEDLREVSLKTLVANDASAEVFAGKDEVDNCVSKANGNVELVRPVAQLNIATTAASLTLGSTPIEPTESKVTVDGLYGKYNVATGAVDTKAERIYTEAAVPGGDFKGGAYELMATNFLGFIPQEGDNVDVKFTIFTQNDGQIEHTVSNVPVKPNYQTNILGNLISATADYNVTLGGWTAPDEVIDIWDGKTISTPDFDADTKTWTIDNGAELAWVAGLVNGTLPDTKATAPTYVETHKFVLGKNIHLGDKEFTPIGIGNKRFSSTFDGNGHIISNFKITKYTGDQAALFGNLAGTVNIKNLTIQKANIVYPGQGDFYASGLVATAYGTVTIENVIVEKSYISGNNKVAGLLAHDGVVSALNINNCHVRDCEIESLNEADGGNVGGLVGLLQAGIQHNISNSSVKNTIINAINSSNKGKRANGEFVACVYDRNNLKVVINDCEVSGNTFTQNEGVTYVSPFGVFVGGVREQTGGSPTVIVDGKTIIQDGLAQDGNTYYVSSAAAFQAALDRYAADKTTNATIVLLENINGDVNFTQVPEKSFVFDGNGKKMTGSIKFLARAGESDSSIQIKNFNFETTDNDCTFIYSSETNYYPNNVTISSCTFKGTGADGNVVPIKLKSAYNLVIEDCEADAVHSLFQNDRGGKNYTINNCTITNAGRGISLNSVIGANVNKVSISASDEKYGIRINAENKCTITITDCNISAFIPVVVRQAKVDVELVFDGTNTMTPSNSDNLWCAIGTTEYETNGTMPTPATGRVIVTLEDTGLNKSGIYGAYVPPVAKVGDTEYATIDEAIAAWTNNTTLTLLDDVTLSDVVTLKSTEHHILNLGTYTLTAASGKNAFEITATGTGASERTAITINADADNPGGIDAGSKAIVYYDYSKGTAAGADDRPIIKINSGVFKGSTNTWGTAGIYFKGGSKARQAATLNISGGEFYCSINGQSKSKLIITGGLFHYSVGSQGDSTAYRLISGGTFKTLGFMTADANNTKFWFGTSMANSNVGLYINDDNYLVVGGPVITGFDGRFQAKATNPTKWSSYLQYSSAAANGLYYTNAEMAKEKHGEANVVLP